MAPAAERLAETLKSVAIAPLSTPVVTNVEGKPNGDEARVRELLVRQVCAPVLWDGSVQEMAKQGVAVFVEIGPGKVLSGLVKRITKDVETRNIEDVATLKGLG